MKFYECKKCGNIMVLLEDSGVIPVCCGSTMELVDPLSQDGPKEKHVPVIEIDDDNAVTVRVGETLHPMLNEHYIKWIVLETDMGKYIHYLDPNSDPWAIFVLQKGECVIRAYEFCSIHSLWVKDYEEKQDC